MNNGENDVKFELNVLKKMDRYDIKKSKVWEKMALQAA